MDIKKEEPKSEQELAKQFTKEYMELCERFGFQITVNPAFKSRDDGTWSIVLQGGVGKLAKANQVKEKGV